MLGVELKSNYGRVRFRITIRGRGRVIVRVRVRVGVTNRFNNMIRVKIIARVTVKV